jgi:pyruvate kinase
VCKRKILGDETFAVCDFNDLADKIKVGDHICVDFGSVVLKVIGFESESSFLAMKNPDHDVYLFPPNNSLIQ